MWSLEQTIESVRLFSNDNKIIASVYLTIILSAFFIIFPSVDLGVTSLFYVAGQGFPAAGVGLLKNLREAGSNISVALGVVLAVALVLKLVYPMRPSLFPPRFSLYFVSLFLLGPALLVNGVLKSFWGRPRPVHIEEFGGRFHFVDAWSFGEHMFVHRSFVSGEAATIACLLPLVLFVPRSLRLPVGGLLMLVVIGVSMNRVAFGAHFLSDVTISIALVLTVAVALWQALYVRYADVFDDERLESELTRVGLQWRDNNKRLVRGVAHAFAAVVRGVERSGAWLGAQLAPTVALSRIKLSNVVPSLGWTVPVLSGVATSLSSAIFGTIVRRLSQDTPTRS